MQSHARHVLVAALAVTLGTAAGCGPRCFRDASPPPARATPSHTLLVGISTSERSDAHCPADRPPEGAPCALGKLPASDATGHPVEVWGSCYYEHAGYPCDPDACTCARATPDASPTFTCSDRIAIE